MKPSVLLSPMCFFVVVCSFHPSSSLPVRSFSHSVRPPPPVFVPSVLLLPCVRSVRSPHPVRLLRPSSCPRVFVLVVIFSPRTFVPSVLLAPPHQPVSGCFKDFGSQRSSQSTAFALSNQTNNGSTNSNSTVAHPGMHVEF